jgi:hypothetical protein
MFAQTALLSNVRIRNTVFEPDSNTDSEIFVRVKATASSEKG